MKEKDWLKEFKHLGDFTDGGETISSYEKVFPNECRIVYRTHENEWGGKSIIDVEVLPVFESIPDTIFRHLRAPSISFFATGFEDFETLEKLVREEIVPMLQKWSIKVI